TNLTYTLGQTTLGTLTYTYDAVGGQAQLDGSWARTGLPQALASANYDATNRITTWPGQVFSYDLNGNLASDGLTSYSWSARNQLVGLNGGIGASFGYDGLERRRSKTVGGTTTTFLYDGVNLVQELSGSTPTANLLTGGGVDETLARTDAGGTKSLLIDALGSALVLADATRTLQTPYTFDPFGATAASGASSTNALQFTGRENDNDGLYYYRARYYAPSIGRFLSEDPADWRSGVDLYAYVGDNPVNLTDPYGLGPL